MQLNLERWIEKVRQEPEHVRMRYVFICVGISMFLIVGVWLLSVREGFQTATTVGGTTDSMNTLIPKPSDLSLETLLKNNEMLGQEEEVLPGDKFFEKEYKVKTTPRYDDEGVMPVPDANKER